jgi:hypothetical protein
MGLEEMNRDVLEAHFWPGRVFGMLMTVIPTASISGSENLLLTFAALIHIFGANRRSEG